MSSARPRGGQLLLGGLVALLAAFPFLEDVTRPLFLVLPLVGVFVAGVVAVRAGRAHVRRALILALIQFAFTAASVLLRDDPVLYKVAVSLTLAVLALLILFSIYCVLRYVMRARVITPDQICAGICAYLMLGFAFAAAFYLLNILVPNSFAENASLRAEAGAPDLMYFSFVTLATLGYGDITPLSRLARSFSVLEAVTGSLYIAVFMARLVSLSASSKDAG